MYDIKLLTYYVRIVRSDDDDVIVNIGNNLPASGERYALRVCLVTGSGRQNEEERVFSFILFYSSREKIVK